MSIIQQRHRIGGQGGRGFQYDQISDRGVVIRIESWVGGWQIRGIRLHFSNGVRKLIGSASGRYAGAMDMNYDDGESVTYLSIYGNGAGTRCGGLRIKTSRGQDYFPHMYKWGLKTEYRMEIGSGVILGAFGRHGADVDSLGMLMLREINDAHLVDMQYSLSGDSILPPRQIDALDVTLANASATDSDRGFQSIVKSRTNGGAWSVTAGITFGQTYTVSGGVPGVAQVGGETTWEVSLSGTYEQTWSDTTGSEIRVPLIAPRRQKTRITVDYYEGNLHRVPYTAQMRYILDNGARFYMNVNGVYDGVSTTRFVQDSEVVANWDETDQVWIDVAE